MAFNGKITLNGKEFDVLKSKVSCERDVDQKGRPSSHVYGVRIDVVVESTDDTSILESTFSEYKPFEGKLVHKQGNEDAEMKKVEFKDAYVIKYSEEFERKDKNPMSIAFTLTAREVACGGAVHKEEWPEG